MRLTNRLLLIIFSLLFSDFLLAEITQKEITQKEITQNAIIQKEITLKKMAQKEIIKSDTYQIGLMVQAVQNALQVRDEKALQTIILYGTDSRYYPMIRGWLFQELVAVESLLYASKNVLKSEKFQIHSNFLKKAIRFVDLE